MLHFGCSKYELQMLRYTLELGQGCFSKALAQVWNCYDYECHLRWGSGCDWVENLWPGAVNANHLK